MQALISCQGSGGYLEVERAQGVGQVDVLRSSRVAVAQEDVVQPLRQHRALVHEVAYALQHRLEVVLLCAWHSPRHACAPKAKQDLPETLGHNTRGVAATTRGLGAWATLTRHTIAQGPMQRLPALHAQR